MAGLRQPHGFSLVELLVSAAMALFVMAGVAALFSTFGRTVSQSQSVVELNARMRNASWQLRQDLVGLTAMPLPRLRPEANAGYLEITDAGTATGDTLALTTSSLGAPFTGRVAGSQGFESPTAEVAWFCEQMPQAQQPAGSPPLFNLHRRQLLVSAAPAVGGFATDISVGQAVLRTFYRDNDLACHLSANRLFASSLGDLTTRANRFLVAVGSGRALDGQRLGEDVILSNVIAFDVRLFNGSGYANEAFQTSENGPAGDPRRGIEVEIRCFDQSTGQERQVTVVHSFEAR
jgi:type II secretory pathway pseudopilin PulG